MHLCEDGSGTEWLFKPAQSKSGTPEEFRAYVQEAGYKVQGIVDPDTAVKVGYWKHRRPVWRIPAEN